MSAVLIVINIKKTGMLKKIISLKMFLLGLVSVSVVTFHMLTIQLTLVSYMISVKRSSLLFSIIIGSLVFKEQEQVRKLFGGIIIIIGIVFIVLSS